MITIDPGDLLTLRPSLDVATASIMIQGAIARAAQIAPCILTDTFTGGDAAKAIILDALVRRADAGGGGVLTQQSAGPFSQSVDTRTAVNLFTAQERADLAGLCGAAGRARTIFTAPVSAVDPLAGVWVNGPLGTGPGGL